MPETWVILNPNAGSCDDPDSLCREVEQWIDARVLTTQEAGDAEQHAKRACEEGVDLVVGIGGDGTLHEVINGLMQGDNDHHPAFAVAAMGTGNDLARSLNIPLDLEQSLQLAGRGHRFPMDLIRYESQGQPPRYMHNAATGGFSTVMAEKLSSEDKQAWGAVAYLKAAIQALGEIPDFEIEATVDGESLSSCCCLAAVANGRSAGGGLTIVPDAWLDDGLMDLLIIGSKSGMERAETIARFLFNRHADDPNVIHRKGKQITLNAEPTMHFNIDGEPIAQTPVTFTAVPAALQVVRPSDR